MLKSYDRKTRIDSYEIEKQKALLTEKKLADVISEYSEDFVGILNENRQYVIVNEKYFKNNPDVDTLAGKRPGEVFGCVHSVESEFGCGNSVSCKYCDVVETLIEVLTTGRRVTRDGHLLLEKGGGVQAVDIRITGVPHRSEESFVLLFIKDISRDKRVEMLERAFFHDVLNTSHTLSSLVSISTVSSDIMPDADKTIEANVSDIVEQIQYYQKLKFAEEGELCVESSIVNLSEEIVSVVESVEGSSYSVNKQIEVSMPDEDVVAFTDRVLYRRIILNLLKNALEASGDGESVGVELKAYDDIAVCSLCNSMVLPERVKTQIFQRSFSTKGPGRGIGTYSVKLLGERYLNGTVDFTSDEDCGTVFNFRIPRR